MASLRAPRLQVDRARAVSPGVQTGARRGSPAGALPETPAARRPRSPSAARPRSPARSPGAPKKRCRRSGRRPTPAPRQRLPRRPHAACPPRGPVRNWRPRRLAGRERSRPAHPASARRQLAVEVHVVLHEARRRELPLDTGAAGRAQTGAQVRALPQAGERRGQGDGVTRCDDQGRSRRRPPPLRSRRCPRTQPAGHRPCTP